MTELITVMQAKPGRALTKTFSPEGVQPYDSAKYFNVKSFPANNIRELSAGLVKLQPLTNCCIIRGSFKGLEFAKTIADMVEPKTNMVARKKKLFDDTPRHWVMIDVDSFEPKDINPTLEPAKAVELYINTYLPECFHDTTHHWQLSASAGTPGKEHILKVHIWFWLETAYTSPQLTAWAKATSKAIDVAPLRVVQAHYTADPVFKGGLVDPVPVRSGLAEGLMGDVVPLVIDEVTLLRANDFIGEADDYEFVNPSEKPGPIGAFHRAFTVEEVFQDILVDEFEFEVGSDRRATWLKGGGSTGGIFITDDRMHVGSTHNTDPFDNRIVNLFDLVRHYKYGHLDDGMDAFELLDMWSRPSYQAAVSELSALPEVQAELEAEAATVQEEAVSLRDRLAHRIRSATSEAGLRSDVCLEIQRKFRNLDKADVKILADLVKAKFTELQIGTIGVNDARELITPARHTLTRPQGVPEWADGYVFVTSRSAIFRHDSQEWLDRTSCEFKHNWEAGVDIDGNQISAFNVLRDLRALPKVEQALYMPQMPPLFELGGVNCVNTYRPSSLPKGKPEANWTEADRRAAYLIARHISLICGKRPEVFQGLMDWLAFNVQFPGVKITYTWLIVGGEGVGKTWIGQMMAVAMGSPNVRIISGQEVLNPTFNGWAEGSAFNIIEEVRVHGHKMDAWDNLKAPLTNNVVPIVRKGKDGYNIPNCSNYLLLTNHDDAVPITLGSRRVGVIKTPFEGDDTAKQLLAMAVEEGFATSSDYFDAIFDAINKHPDVVRELMASWKISDDFSHTGRAPATDERSSMVLNNRSIEEVEIRDAISEGAFCVTERVISPKYLRAHLAMNHDIQTTTERLAIQLRKLGYSSFENRVKYKGEPLRLWTKGISLGEDNEINMAEIRKVLDGGGTTGTRDFDEGFLQ